MSNPKFLKVITVKLGGSTIDSEEVLHQLAEDIGYLSEQQLTFVVVHGAGKEISREMESSGIRPVKIAGLRVTDNATMTVVERVMNLVNDRICSILQGHGLPAEKVLGVDGLLLCKKLTSVKDDENGIEREVDLGRVGFVERVFPEILENLLNDGKTPVVAPYGCDAEGLSFNINADTAAGSIAGACSDEFILLTDVDGVVISTSGKPQIAKSLTVSEVKKLIEAEIIQGGMLPKVEACIHALDSGVKVARIVNGFADHPLRATVLQAAIGTRIIV